MVEKAKINSTLDSSGKLKVEFVINKSSYYSYYHQLDIKEHGNEV